jgi:hypothetical protein
MFVGVLGLVLFALLILIVVVKYRNNRISGFLNTGAGGPTGRNMQEIQGLRAIGSGGLFGVGLGHGTAKWGWVPYASTDFIFAILGEELGLVGTACVVLLYSGLAYAGLRVARRVRDPFMRFAATAAVAWIVGQALVNIGAVIHLIPITGVPLPLISQGLSSVLATLAAIGMLLSFARSEPGAREAMAASRSRLRARLPAALRHDGATPAPAGYARSSRQAAARRPSSAAGRQAPASSPAGREPDRVLLSVRSGRNGRSGRSRLADPGSRPGSGSPPGRLSAVGNGKRPGPDSAGSHPAPAGPAARALPASQGKRQDPARKGGRLRQSDGDGAIRLPGQGPPAQPAGDAAARAANARRAQTKGPRPPGRQRPGRA